MAQNIYSPENVTITIAGNTLTTKIYNFKDEGGEITDTKIPVMGRRLTRTVKSKKEPYTTTFDFTSQNLTIGNTLAVGSYVSTAVFTGSGGPGITITYTDGVIQAINYEQSSDDVLKGNITIEYPPYNSLGSDNRVIS